MSAALRVKPTDLVIRAIDFTLAAIGLLFAAPVFLLVIPVLRFTGEGEVFYCQTRIGRGGRPFGLLKFATMVKNASSIGAGDLTLPNDPRVFPVGRFLRKTKLNELPQLINILAGDISVIGPRPQTPHYFNAFSPEQREIVSSIRPGLSGVGSVVFRNEEEIFAEVPDPVAFDHNVIVPYKGAAECWFVEHRSISLYFYLIFLTLVVTILPGLKMHRNLLKVIPTPPAELTNLL